MAAKTGANVKTAKLNVNDKDYSFPLYEGTVGPSVMDIGKLYNEALRRLATHPVGQKAQRYAIAIGQDASIEELQAFIGNDRTPVFEARNGDMLADFLKFVAVSSIRVSSQPVNQKADEILEDMAAQAKAAKSRENSWVF